MTQPSAQSAIDILSYLEKKTSPSMLAYWVTPNTVLTLSGARAFSDGVFYHEDNAILQAWTNEIAKSVEIIKSGMDIYFATSVIEKSAAKESYASYDLLVRQGLKYVFEQTELVPTAKQDFLVRKLSGEKLVKAITDLLKENKDLEGFNDENLHHIAFGILVGYPDKAILGSVTKWEENDPFAEPLIDADIRGAGYYLCPQPVYSYPRHLVTDSVIKTHEQLWSSILKDFYNSHFHSILARDPQFQKKAENLGLTR